MKRNSSSEIEVVGEKAQNPTVIFVVEGNHGDMIYSSLVKQIAERCISRDLKFLILSEFKDQNEKLETQELSNIPDPETHEETTNFLNKNLTPMGNLRKRFEETISNLFKALPDDVTPSMLLEELKKNVDNLEALQLLNREIEIRKDNEEKKLVKLVKEILRGRVAKMLKIFGEMATPLFKVLFIKKWQKML